MSHAAVMMNHEVMMHLLDVHDADDVDPCRLDLLL
jgi:hypothetical protein